MSPKWCKTDMHYQHRGCMGTNGNKYLNKALKPSGPGVAETYPSFHSMK